MSETIHLTVQDQLPVGLTTEQARVINAVSPTAEVERVEGGAVLTVHDLNGTTTATLYDGATGAQGPAGPAGQDGADGVSPTVTVTDITGGHRVTITDADGTKTVDVMDGADGQPGQAGADGQDGADGFSPTASVSKSGGTATITITDKNGTTTATVSDGTDGQDGHDGQDGAPGVGVPTGGTDGQMLVKDGATDYATKWANAPTVHVTDVQVNGSSVVTQGVANVPIASSSSFGVFKTGSTTGTGLYLNPTSGILFTSPADVSELKAGTNTNRPVVSSHSHESTFYGLAKAAGSDMASSSNAVGQYTDAAKRAIKRMLGINDKWELIYETTTTEDVADITVMTDSTGQPFELTEMMVIFTAGLPTTGTRDSFYTQIWCNRPNNTTVAESIPSWQYTSATSTMQARMIIEANDGAPWVPLSMVATGEGNTQNIQSMAKSTIATSFYGFKVYQSGSTKSLIPSGSTLRIYGIRA